MCSAVGHVRFTPNSDRESGLPAKLMSALPPKSRHVQCTTLCPLWANGGHWPVLFDHFVGEREYGRRNREAQRFRGLEINYQRVLGRRLHRKVGRLLAFEDAIDVAGGAPVLVDEIRAVGD